MQIGFSGCEAFDRQDGDEEEDGEDGESFGCSSLKEF